MDFHLKQWRNQHGSEEQHSTKMPKFLPESHHQHQHQHSSVLPLFVPEPNSKVSNLSDSTLATTNRFPRMGIGHFSLSQWQELELQALIFRYMLAGSTVPPELLQPIKKSLLHSHPYFLHHHPLQHYQPATLLQSGGYWSRGAMDPEPGRCRRTDGKKWRCSRDVVGGQKYCERHMHRGRNRSRKPVELPTPTTGAGTGTGTVAGSLCASSSISSPPPLTTASLKSPFHHLLQLNQRSTGTKNEEKGLFESEDHVGGDGRSSDSGGHMLRHFFDDWPRSLQETDNAENSGRVVNSSTCLSISMPGNNNNNNNNISSTSSDVSLKLSTGYGEEQPGPRNESVGLEAEQQLQLNWAGGGWASGNHVASSMGGPLAEALRSSTSSTSSPTSVLHQLPRSSASETSFIST